MRFFLYSAAVFITNANIAAADCHTANSNKMLSVKRAFCFASSAVELCDSHGIIVAFLAKVGICTAVVLGKVAAEVALELDVVQAVLFAHKLLFDAKLAQLAGAAYQICFFEGGSLRRFETALHSAVNIASKESRMAIFAFIVFAAEHGVGDWLFVIGVERAGDALFVHHRVLLDFFKSCISDGTLELAHGDLFNEYFANV